MTGQLRRLSVARIFRDGLPIEAPWGYVSVTPREISQSQGWVRAVIHVYPPGTTTGARRLLHLRNGAKSWAGVIALSLLIAFGGIGALPTIGIAAAIGVVVMLVVAYISLILGTRRAASRTHTVSASATRAGMSETKLFETVARQLDELDSAGHDPVQYEAEWWRIYRGIEDSRRAA